MRWSSGTLALAAVALGWPEVCRSDVDPSFGDGGVATVSVVDAAFDRDDAGLFSDRVPITTRPDGKIVLATREGDGDFVVFRFEVDGALDATFGTAGKATIDLGGDDEPADVLAGPDDTILITGTTRGDDGDQLALVRLLASGALDESFGDGGVVLEEYGRHTQGHALGLAPDGDVLVAGSAEQLGTIGGFVARFDHLGAPEGSFGTGGVYLSGGDEAFHAMAVQPDGKVVAAGLWQHTFDIEGEFYRIGAWLLRRLLENGTPDPSFGQGGTVSVDTTETVPSQFRYSDARGVAVLPSGAIVAVGGNAFTPSSSSTRVVSARLTPAGVLDGAYGDAGIAKTRVFPTPPYWPIVPDRQRSHGSAVLPRSDGTLIVTGLARDQDPSSTAVALRYLPDGSLDPTWSGDGILDVGAFGLGSTTDSALQPDERTILAVRDGGDIELRRLLGYVPCGNGLLDNPAEECDDGNRDDGDCCSSTCRLDPAGSACDDDGTECTSEACDGNGACEHAPVPDGTACFDEDLCTQGDTCLAGVCAGAATPAALCRRASAGSLLLRSLGGVKDTVTWSWKKGEETLLSEIPAQPYSFCLYEGGSDLLDSLDTPGLPCSDEHCFKTSPRKTSYASKPATFDGVQQITLAAGDDGASSVKLKGFGPGLPMPSLPLETPLVVQLRGANGVCFEATYSDPSRNDLLMFRARPD